MASDNYLISPKYFLDDDLNPPGLGRLRWRPAWAYQPPHCSDEVALWSAVHLHALANTTQIVQKILPEGRRQDNLWRDGSIIVALRRGYVREVNCILDRGAWGCLSSDWWGGNIVELYAYVNRRNYREAIYALANEGKLTGLNNESYPKNQINQWHQVRDPLHPDFESHLLPWCYPHDSDILVYYNVDGHPILQVIRHRLPNGKTICTYRSPWSYRGGPISQWVEILPQRPFPIYNANMIQSGGASEVFLVENEFLANERSKNERLAHMWNWEEPKRVFIAVPCGLKNLPEADLAPLRGQKIFVILGQNDLEEGSCIQHALQNAGAIEVHFSIDGGETFTSFANLEKIAEQRNIILRSPPLKRIVSTKTQFVIPAGERIPGGDDVRLDLISPIIRTGDIIWLYAAPKTGKTWIALSMAYAVARGNCNIASWHTNDPAGVLYVDGEMKPDQLQESISMIMNGAGELTQSAPFDIICAQALDDGFVDITLEETQEEIEKTLREKKFKLLVLDNIQALSSNKPSAVNQLFPWLRKLARAGIAVIVVDHTNGDGEVQGSSTKERVPDLLIYISYPDASAKRDGRILVEFPYARRLHGTNAEPFQLHMVFTKNTFRVEVVLPERNDCDGLQPKAIERVVRIAQVVFARDHENLSFPKLHKKYGISKSTAYGDYQNASTLIGDKKTAFDKELQRLIGGQSPSESN
ncbi:AAA family ATPase [Acidocella sp.]|uniref:AAA family ATPase n=1 Tax=Acidocella sp. TaxID=50710 RepID=UPI00261D459E|nr:AAA family ATPase [Acidocella sp.]